MGKRVSLALAGKFSGIIFCENNSKSQVAGIESTGVHDKRKKGGSSLMG